MFWLAQVGLSALSFAAKKPQKDAAAIPNAVGRRFTDFQQNS
jgi:hypothetical protein